MWALTSLIPAPPPLGSGLPLGTARRRRRRLPHLTLPRSSIPPQLVYFTPAPPASTTFARHCACVSLATGSIRVKCVSRSCCVVLYLYACLCGRITSSAQLQSHRARPPLSHVVTFSPSSPLLVYGSYVLQAAVFQRRVCRPHSEH